jgi:hypothetical protein
MEVKDVHRYNKGVDEVFKFFSDTKTIKAKFEGCGARNIEILECKAVKGGHLTKSSREVPADVPGVLKTFLGEWNKLIQTEKWQFKKGNIYYCDIDIDPGAVPVKMAGTLNIRPTAEGCEIDVMFSAKCGIPFIGGKLEDFVINDIKKSMDTEYKCIKKMLAKKKK